MIFGYHLNIALIYLILLHSKMKGKLETTLKQLRGISGGDLFSAFSLLAVLNFHNWTFYVKNDSSLLSFAVCDMMRKQISPKREKSSLFSRSLCLNFGGGIADEFYRFTTNLLRSMCRRKRPRNTTFEDKLSCCRTTKKNPFSTCENFSFFYFPFVQSGRHKRKFGDLNR